jgi:hypothetical protein
MPVLVDQPRSGTDRDERDHWIPVIQEASHEAPDLASAIDNVRAFLDEKLSARAPLTGTTVRTTVTVRRTLPPSTLRPASFDITLDNRSITVDFEPVDESLDTW